MLYNAHNMLSCIFAGFRIFSLDLTTYGSEIHALLNAGSG